MLLNFNHINNRFWNFVDLKPFGYDVTDEDCWLWTGGKDKDGYGLFKIIPRHMKRATHVAWYIRHGRLPSKGMLICHKCDSPSCVNPSHLFEGTYNDNNKDMTNKGRALVVGSKNGNSKLNESIVKEIKITINNHPNYTNYYIADLFKVSYQTISGIRCGTFWKHVTI